MTVLITEVKNKVKNNPRLERSFRILLEALPVTTRLAITELTDNPYSKLEIQNKIIFIHIPKTAGNSIINALYERPATGHHTASRYYSADTHMYKKFYKFSFVRNPWDRLVSAYHYLYQGGKGRYDKEFRDKYLSNTTSFDSFIDQLQNVNFRKKILKWPHFRPQASYLENKNGEIDIDFLGRFETINHDFESLCKILNKKGALKKNNSSTHNGFREYYHSDKMINTVEEIYEKDCRIFDYSF